MRRLQPISFLLIISMIVMACSRDGSEQPVSTLIPGINSTPTSLENSAALVSPITSTISPTETQQPPTFTQYKLKAILDYDAHQVSVEQEVDYINNTGVLLKELALVIDANRFPEAFNLNTLTWQDGQAIAGYHLEGIQLTLPLQNPLPEGERISFSLAYQLNLPNQNDPFGYTERQTNLGDWYAFVPPYRLGEGWMVREPAYLGEHLVYDIADFDVEIQLASPTSAEGRSLVIAASALAEERDGKYHYNLEQARSFALSISDQYQVLKTSVGDVEVLSYSFPFHATADEPALKATADALAVYNRLYGPYAHKSLSVVEADFLNGMEFEGLFFLSHAFYDYFTGTPENNLIIIAAHETAHQWFYGWVGNDQALEPWLDEALSTYSESLFYESVYPDELDWWWQNRIYFHDPDGWVDTTIYQAAGFYPYRDAVYLRGTLFLKDLEDLIGREPFMSFLVDYLNIYRYKIASSDDFFALLRTHTSQDFSQIVDLYFENR
jgi:hypothetical protein